jgi:hypothetical protein
VLQAIFDAVPADVWWVMFDHDADPYGGLPHFDPLSGEPVDEDGNPIDDDDEGEAA